MMFYVNLLSIVIAVSLDGFGVGITYGMRKIRITFGGLFMIMCCSGVIVLTSMTIGHIIQNIISPTITTMIGSFILIALGVFVFVSVALPTSTKKRKNRALLTEKLRLHRLQSVMSDPTQADKDKSGIISTSEAFILGTALALDAFAAGLGASMLGYNPIITALLIASMSGLFLSSGIKLGNLLSKNKTLAKLPYLPPLFLITIGIYHLL